MNITFIALILTLILIPAYCDFYGDDYGDAYRHYSKYWRRKYGRKSVNAIACANAVAGFNGGITRLTTDIREHANKWVIYADLDALDEVSYYISHSCHDQPLELVDQQIANDEEENEENQERTEGCDDLFLIIGSILAQDETLAFRGSYETGAKLSKTALRAGRDLGDNCIIRLEAITEEEAERDAAANAEESDGANEAAIDEDEWDLSDEREVRMNSDLSWGFGAFDVDDDDDGEVSQERREEREEQKEEKKEEREEEREEQREEREEREEERREEKEEQREEKRERQEANNEVDSEEWNNEDSDSDNFYANQWDIGAYGYYQDDSDLDDYSDI